MDSSTNFSFFHFFGHLKHFLNGLNFFGENLRGLKKKIEKFNGTEFFPLTINSKGCEKNCLPQKKYVAEEMATPYVKFDI